MGSSHCPSYGTNNLQSLNSVCVWQLGHSNTRFARYGLCDGSDVLTKGPGSPGGPCYLPTAEMI